MLSFILWIFGCIVVIPAMIYIFNKINTEPQKSKKDTNFLK